MTLRIGRRMLGLGALGLAVTILGGCSLVGGESDPSPSPTPEPRLWRGELTLASGRLTPSPRDGLLTLNRDIVTHRVTKEQRVLTPEQLQRVDELILALQKPSAPSTPKVGPSRRLDVTSDDGKKVSVYAQPGDEPTWGQLAELYAALW